MIEFNGVHYLKSVRAKGRVNVIGALLAGVLLSTGLTASNVDAFVGKTIHWIVF